MSLNFKTLEELFLSIAESVRPAERLSISEATEKYRYIKNPGSYIGKWNNRKAPYLVEPMDTLGSDEFTAMCFVGPARTGKSDMFINWMTSTAICDPTDMMLIHMTQATARDYSIGDLRKAFRHSKDLGARVIPGRHNMNVHDIRFVNGMRVLIKWPTISELSGKTVARVWLMDYDRMTQDVDKEGTPFDLGRKRTQTYGRNGMTVAESSPGFEVSNPRHVLAHPHEAPPTPGILSIYNRGDQRRRYWRCVQCKEPFEPTFLNMTWPDSADPVESAEAATLRCPKCGFNHTHGAGPGQPGKGELDWNGKWIKRGQLWLPDGSVAGTPIRSDIASFWLKGPAATFTTWKDLVYKYLQAKETFATTGDFGALKTCINTDWGDAFVNPAIGGERLPEELKARADGMLGKRVVPRGVRFLFATVDVQKNRFEVAVWGVGVGGDIWVIDRFNVRYSNREGEVVNGKQQYQQVEPDANLEDWQLLVEAVVEKTYPLQEDPLGRHMMIKNTFVDSGYATAKAYEFWRWLRDDHPARHHQRVQLLKGISNPAAPRVRLAYPDSERKDRMADARGEVPVLELNSNMIKDQVYGMLGRVEPNGGRVNFPTWLPNDFYSELTVETRDDKGKWDNPKKLRNESWDLLCYCVAGCVSPRFAGIEQIDWANPPSFAANWDDDIPNDFIFIPDGSGAMPYESTGDVFDLAALGKLLA